MQMSCHYRPEGIEVGPSVFAITGITRETFECDGKEKLLPDWTVGTLNETTETIMHGETWVDEVATIGYAYLKVSLKKMEDFENTLLADRHLGAVSGGSIYSSNGISSAPYQKEQEWGVIDPLRTHFLVCFYNFDRSRYNHVKVCFDRTTVTPVSSFWKNGEVVVGPNTAGGTTNWGLNLKSLGSPVNFSIGLEKVRSTVVLAAEFPALLAKSTTKTIEPEVVLSQVYTNRSSAKAAACFTTETPLLDTHTFLFEEGSEVDWSAGWKAKVPLLSGPQTTVEVEVSFDAHQLGATSKTRIVNQNADIKLTRMTGCKATARYTKRLLTTNAIITVQKTYTNGAVETRKVPAKYTGVSCDDAMVDLEDMPV